MVGASPTRGCKLETKKGEPHGRVDSSTRHMGAPREEEPSPLRSDDVSLARVLTNMTSVLLRPKDSSDAKTTGVPKCHRVYSVTNMKRLQDWRDHRQKYLKAVRIFKSVPGNPPIEPEPIINLVDPKD